MKKLLFFLLFLATVSTSAQSSPINMYSSGDLIVFSYDFKGIREVLERKQSDTTYVINFWATWCAPCIAELPHFEKITADYAGKPVKVILISLDFTKQVEKSLLPFIKRKKLKSEVLHLSDPDANAWISEVDASWSGAIPATLIYNPSKNLRKFYERSFTFEELQSELNPFLQ